MNLNQTFNFAGCNSSFASRRFVSCPKTCHLLFNSIGDNVVTAGCSVAGIRADYLQQGVKMRIVGFAADY